MRSNRALRHHLLITLSVSDTCGSQAFTQRPPISSGSTAAAPGTSRSNYGRSNCMPGTPQLRRELRRPLWRMRCKIWFCAEPVGVIHWADGLLYCLCSSSEDLDLGDVMDIELDFPSLTESQNAPVPVHSSSVQVSFWNINNKPVLCGLQWSHLNS